MHCPEQSNTTNKTAKLPATPLASHFRNQNNNDDDTSDIDDNGDNYMLIIIIISNSVNINHGNYSACVFGSN